MIMTHRIVTFILQETLSLPGFDEISDWISELHMARKVVGGLWELWVATRKQLAIPKS